MFNMQTKVGHLLANNASNNLPALGQHIIAGFEAYCQHEGDEEKDGERSDGDETIMNLFADEVTGDDQKDVFNVGGEFVRLLCFIYTLQLVIKDGLVEAASVRLTIASIATMSHKRTTVAEQRQGLNVSIPTTVQTGCHFQYLTVSKIIDISNAI